MVYMEQIHVGILSLVRSWAARDLPALLSDTVSWELVELIERWASVFDWVLCVPKEERKEGGWGAKREREREREREVRSVAAGIS